ncbi:MAG: metallophosphoesterase family protein [Elusimicrobiota bacterium]
MRYGIISDIHGNFNAMKEVLKFLDGQGVDKIINCGDIVGYGPEPHGCIECISERKDIYSILGNHDWAVIKRDTWKFNPVAERAVIWTREHIKQENIDFLCKLDCKGAGENFMFVHGSPRDPINEYVFSTYQAGPNFEYFEHNICFVGHTHRPACFCLDDKGEVSEINFIPDKELKLKKKYRYLINVGSVGQPRDGIPDGCVIIYDSKKYTIIQKRIKYNIDDTCDKIIRAGLPEFLATRLKRGI